MRLVMQALRLAAAAKGFSANLWTVDLPGIADYKFSPASKRNLTKLLID